MNGSARATSVIGRIIGYSCFTQVMYQVALAIHASHKVMHHAVIVGA